ncbi:hypothetical protein ACA910_006486 [Epithemia clementina (nom. ined.)]
MGRDTTDPCDPTYWISEIAKHDQLLDELTLEQIQMVHITFTVNQTTDRNIQNDPNNNSNYNKPLLNRSREMQYSVACLKTAIPQIHYQTVALGDFANYQQGMAQTHAWLAARGAERVRNSAPTQRQQQRQEQELQETVPPAAVAATFVLDTDLFANPHSGLTPHALLHALHNVDLALVYNPSRGSPDQLQRYGLQGSFLGQRHTIRTQLFHQCVAHRLQQASSSRRPMLQQYVLNQVLEASSLGQFLRVRWLPPEFHCCQARSWRRPSDFVVLKGPELTPEPCYFLHGHGLATAAAAASSKKQPNGGGGDTLDTLCGNPNGTTGSSSGGNGGGHDHGNPPPR